MYNAHPFLKKKKYGKVGYYACPYTRGKKIRPGQSTVI